ncbi:uncharacterized protein LOC110344857 isoform X2 [Heterocephalus glaber]|uniref:Uncharacterized protein LOC110344857 isoform X2 n=1 Tax=Heterocephalus glaber TaxID=10181 RepID=A0AAX6RFA8_HETGA|nr:uncharacterized protein LOC110344857 isoform X2 [Heterocephalus glaber]
MQKRKLQIPRLPRVVSVWGWENPLRFFRSLQLCACTTGHETPEKGKPPCPGQRTLTSGHWPGLCFRQLQRERDEEHQGQAAPLGSQVVLAAFSVSAPGKPKKSGHTHTGVCPSEPTPAPQPAPPQPAPSPFGLLAKILQNPGRRPVPTWGHPEKLRSPSDYHTKQNEQYSLNNIQDARDPLHPSFLEGPLGWLCGDREDCREHQASVTKRLSHSRQSPGTGEDFFCRSKKSQRTGHLFITSCCWRSLGGPQALKTKPAKLKSGPPGWEERGIPWPEALLEEPPPISNSKQLWLAGCGSSFD